MIDKLRTLIRKLQALYAVDEQVDILANEARLLELAKSTPDSQEIAQQIVFGYIKEANYRYSALNILQLHKELIEAQEAISKHRHAYSEAYALALPTALEDTHWTCGGWVLEKLIPFKTNVQQYHLHIHKIEQQSDNLGKLPIFTLCIGYLAIYDTRPDAVVTRASYSIDYVELLDVLSRLKTSTIEEYNTQLAHTKKKSAMLHKFNINRFNRFSH